MTDDKPQGPWRIALVSAAVLILELAFIRQVPAEVRIISYFTNLIMMASFFGLGLGMILTPVRRLPQLLPIGLLALAGFVLWARGLVIYEEAQGVHYWLQYEQAEGTARRLPLLAAALIAFVATALPFVALGGQLAHEMERFDRLVAYGWDIAGSLAGSLIFVASSALELPPWIWPPVVALVWSVFFVRAASWRVLSAIAGLSFLLFSQSPHAYRWSPYYFVQYAHEAHGLRVWVNSSFHQFALDTSSAFDETQEHARRQVMDKFGVPYDIYRQHHGGQGPRSVLVLGAGTGNDVNLALSEGAQQVTAVEIDPVILDLGREHNASKPYSDPRVRVVLDDARHYLRASAEKFDLVVFGTLDSQTLLSGNSNIRLENYVYTRESFFDARERLGEDGMVVTYYSVFKPWLLSRLYHTVCPAFEGHCRVLGFSDARLFNTLLVGGPGIDSFRSEPTDAKAFEGGMASVDDWPFLYLEHPTIASHYLGLIVAIFALLGGVFLLVRRIHGHPASHLNFLLLGVGFTLMEAAAIVRMALLFGSTWTVNAAVFSAVLLMIFVANLLVLKGRAPSLNMAWAGVVIGAVANYAVTMAPLLELSALARGLCAAALIGVPVFFAAVCFSRLFGREASTGYALGVNLVGAMAGGFVEYVSMIVGMRSVWALVVVVYLLALLATRRYSAPSLARTG